jgi:ribulose-phosphate 3-epimerase
MKRTKLAASILAGNLGYLSRSVKEASDARVDLIHIDVADGHFAPNITLGAGTVAAIRSVTSLQLDTHLMISNPEKHIKEFIKAGADILTIHAETCDLQSACRLMNAINREGGRMGLALKPRTPLPRWSTYLPDLHLINVMAVKPGFSGQPFDSRILPKLRSCSERLLQKNKDVEIEVDGGVDTQNARTLVDAGASILVAGAAIYRKGDVQASVRELRKCMRAP